MAFYLLVSWGKIRYSYRMHIRCLLLLIFLLLMPIVGCGGKSSGSGAFPEQEETPGRRRPRTEIKDPAGQIPAPSLPPALAEREQDERELSTQISPRGGISYKVECIVRKTASRGAHEPFWLEMVRKAKAAGKDDDAERAAEQPKSTDPQVLVDTFEKTSSLNLLLNTPPDTLTGLEQRLGVSLKLGGDILKSYGFYSGKVRGFIVRPRSADGSGHGPGTEKSGNGHGPSSEHQDARDVAAGPRNRGGSASQGQTRALGGTGTGDGTAPANGKAEEAPSQIVRVIFIPGEQYKTGKTSVMAVMPADAPARKKLPRDLAGVGLKPGSPAIASDVLGAVDRVIRQFQENGYPKAAVTSTRYVVDHSARELEAHVKIDAGPFVRMGELERTGPEFVSDHFLRSMRTWEPGDPWSQSKIESFQENLRNCGLFQSMDISPSPELDKNGNHPIRLSLSGAPERTVGGALKYNSDFGPGVQGFWENRNLTGRGDRLRIEMPLWADMQEFFGTYRLPYFMRKDQTFIARGGFLNQDTDAYALTSASGALGIERRLSRWWTGSVQASVEGGSIKEPDKDRLSYLMYGLPVTATYDNTNSLLDATRGWRVISSVAPYSGDYDGAFAAIRGRIDAHAYFPMTEADKLVLALRLSAGTVVGADSPDVPPSVRFYSGGGGSVRGYAYQSIGPRNSDDKPLGGKSLFETSVETRWRLNEEWGLVFFLDGGTVYDGTPITPSDTMDTTMRWGAGIGARFYTAIGPVRVDIATPLNPRADDEMMQFYISIGQSF